MKSKKKRNISDTNLLLTITIVVFFAMYIGAMIFQGGGFLKTQTFFNILNANAALLITSCGLSLVMITGGIDISVGGVVALVSMSCGVYLDYMGGNVAMSILIALGIGLAFGLVQGFLVAYLDIQPFIVTLAGMFFARGMTTIVHTSGRYEVKYSQDSVCASGGSGEQRFAGNRYYKDGTEGKSPDAYRARKTGRNSDNFTGVSSGVF